ncbi:hypothetical protein SETIT_2G223800v2 [Setaria italica]|uniref:Uncharacterized protein n=1 Tax=Setaria italica TaxID=4555 RepID=A0A368Q2K3_SETIT|nr:hypothetical protein SETIT_2G223800v2 [Setaria italica]
MAWAAGGHPRRQRASDHGNLEVEGRRGKGGVEGGRERVGLASTHHPPAGSGRAWAVAPESPRKAMRGSGSGIHKSSDFVTRHRLRSEGAESFSVLPWSRSAGAAGGAGVFILSPGSPRPWPPSPGRGSRRPCSPTGGRGGLRPN